VCTFNLFVRFCMRPCICRRAWDKFFTYEKPAPTHSGARSQSRLHSRAAHQARGWIHTLELRISWQILSWLVHVYAAVEVLNARLAHILGIHVSPKRDFKAMNLQPGVIRPKPA
jgi:hypothetical protein